MGAHHDHHHHHSCNAQNRNRVGLAALLTGLFMVVEVIGGLISGSLALLADAGHMLTDFAALFMAWGAFMLARRPASSNLTFGYGRMSVLAAFVNGLTLFFISVWIIVEAIKRFQNPGEVLAGAMLWVAVAGLAVNIIVFMILRGADQDNLNIRGAVLHVLGDLLGSVAAIVAAIIILQSGWTTIDPLLSVLVAILILRSAWMLIRDSAHILLEGAPADLDRQEIKKDLLRDIEGLTGIGDMHIWCLTEEKPMMTLEVQIADSADRFDLCQAIKDYLKSNYHIDHVTLEVSPLGAIIPEAPCGLHSAE